MPRLSHVLALARTLRARAGVFAAMVFVFSRFGLAEPAPAIEVKVQGTDAMVATSQRWVGEYMRTHPGILIRVQGGGSDAGIAALVNGTVDICQASRPMKGSERAQVRAKSGADPLEYVVGRDALSVFASSSNRTSELTMAQLKDIFTGKVTNWKDVGGADQTIVIYAVEGSSGARAFFKEGVMDGEGDAPRTRGLSDDAAVAAAVATEANGIGYAVLAEAPGVKILRISRNGASRAIAPSSENVRNGMYPLSRPLFFSTRVGVRAEAKDFIDWVLSPNAQGMIRGNGHMAVR